MQKGELQPSSPSAKSGEQDEKDALAMLTDFEYLNNASFRQTWRKCCAKNPRALIYPLPDDEPWSSILHHIIVDETTENLLFACRLLQFFNIDIGTYKYENDDIPCSLLRVGVRKSHEKAQVLLEFGATLPKDELWCRPSYFRNVYDEVKEVVDAKRARVAHVTLVILSMHRVKKPRRTWFQIVGRDMTRLVAQEVFYSGLFLWP